MNRIVTANRVMFSTNDPAVLVDGKPVPALTSLLHRVCDNDPERFEEATRIVALFIKEALRSS